jgi:hypothetical protein
LAASLVDRERQQVNLPASFLVHEPAIEERHGLGGQRQQRLSLLRQYLEDASLRLLQG